MDSRAQALQAWLSEIDSLPLECDGLTRVAATLLRRDGIAHQVYMGALYVADVGRIEPHFWVQFPEGLVCDFRARMWLGQADAVPHGIFMPSQQHHYEPAVELAAVALGPALFNALTNRPIGSFDRFGDCQNK